MIELIEKVKRKILSKIESKMTPLAKNPRSDDIYLVSFPKSGNTWISFLITNVMIEYLKLDMKVNFYNLHFFIPDVSFCRDIPEGLEFYPFRRIIKSHYGFSSYYRNVILLIRDPRDLMVSYYYYRKNLGQYSGDLSSFLRSQQYGIDNWVKHTESWLSKSYPGQGLHLFFFEDFKKDPHMELKRLFKLMGFCLRDDLIKKAIENSSFENMREIEKKSQSYSMKKYKKFNFVRRGKHDQGKEDLSERDMAHIKKIAGNTMSELGYG